MQYQLTDNEAWTLALMTLIYQPMIKSKTGSANLDALIGHLPEDERNHLSQGVQALVDMGFFLIKNGTIYITNRSEAALQLLATMSTGSQEEVKDSLESSPTISRIIKDINDEVRLSYLARVPAITPVLKSQVQVAHKPTTIGPWAKIGYMIFVMWILLGLFKVIAEKF